MTIEQEAEKWAEDNCETIRNVHEYNNANDLVRGFIAGASSTIDDNGRLRSALNKIKQIIDMYPLDTPTGAIYRVVDETLICK